MTTPSETGLAMKVANLEKLIAIATSMGEAYNPNRADLKLPALKALHALAKEALSVISSIEPEHKKAVSARKPPSSHSPSGSPASATRSRHRAPLPSSTNSAWH